MGGEANNRALLLLVTQKKKRRRSKSFSSSVGFCITFKLREENNTTQKWSRLLTRELGLELLACALPGPRELNTSPAAAVVAN